MRTHRSVRILILLALSFAVAGTAGCTGTKFHERARLLDRAMVFDRDPSFVSVFGFERDVGMHGLGAKIGVVFNW